MNNSSVTIYSLLHVHRLLGFCILLIGRVARGFLLVGFPLTKNAYRLATVSPASTPALLVGRPSETTDDNDNDDTPALVVPVTPCTRICRYNSNVFDGQVCIGCYRETYEIATWASMSPEEKYFALLDAVDRLDETAATATESETDTSTTTDAIATMDNANADDDTSSLSSRQELLRQANYWKTLAEGY